MPIQKTLWTRVYTIYLRPETQPLKNPPALRGASWTGPLAYLALQARPPKHSLREACQALESLGGFGQNVKGTFLCTRQSLEGLEGLGLEGLEKGLAGQVLSQKFNGT
jgi:hypothetical protein